ncbi:MAG: D-hexose-6-phosphate mutarotase [Burkholderiales bacterium]
MSPAPLVPSPGLGGLPRIGLVAADGARAEIYLHGAHVTSWFPAGAGEDRLFVSEKAIFTDDAAIRGGVPICFPQFADQGALPMHGFVRALPWQLVQAGELPDGRAQAHLRCAATGATRASWPHAFVLDYTVTVGGATLSLVLDVHNPDTIDFAFTAALHTYLRVRDLRATRVRGLAGAHYRDKVLGVDDAVEAAQELPIDRFVDRVYRAAPADLVMLEPGRRLDIRTAGFCDTVVWNPDAPKSASIADMEAGGYLRFLCIEAAVAHAPVTVAAGATWHGAQTLHAR